MITAKARQKFFTDTEVMNLTGICAEHLQNLAKRHHLGFIAAAAERFGYQPEHLLFTRRDLMALVSLFDRCTH